MLGESMVGVTGFEPAIPTSRILWPSGNPNRAPWVPPSAYYSVVGFGGSVLEFDTSRKLRLGENDEVEIFCSGLALRFRAGQAHSDFRVRAK